MKLLFSFKNCQKKKKSLNKKEIGIWKCIFTSIERKILLSKVFLNYIVLKFYYKIIHFVTNYTTCWNISEQCYCIMLQVSELVEDAKTKGAKIAAGGQKHELGENFYQPTLITDVSPDMRCSKEEVFGPVASIIK